MPTGRATDPQQMSPAAPRPGRPSKRRLDLIAGIDFRKILRLVHEHSEFALPSNQDTRQNDVTRCRRDDKSQRHWNCPSSSPSALNQLEKTFVARVALYEAGEGLQEALHCRAVVEIHWVVVDPQDDATRNASAQN